MNPQACSESCGRPPLCAASVMCPLLLQPSLGIQSGTLSHKHLEWSVPECISEFYLLHPFYHWYRHFRSSEQGVSNSTGNTDSLAEQKTLLGV